MANNIAFQAMGNTVACVATAANTQSSVTTITCLLYTSDAADE